MKKTNIFSALLLAVTFLSACQSPASKKTPPAVPPQQEANLLQIEAEARAKAVHHINYELAIQLGERSEVFEGHAAIAFDLTGSAKNLFLDFKNGAKIARFAVNGKTLQPVFANHRIQLPEAELKPGGNAIEIDYEQRFSNDGRGLHRFVDPEDHRVYLYTQFENFDAHQMFPCFDQPDLKATFKLTVSAPKAWEVISTTQAENVKDQADQKIWSFPVSPLISTYLFSLHAGEYKKWESTAGSIPLRLFARQSISRYVDTKTWFTPTKAGLKFYGEYFGYPYPFKKYDQIIVPEFNAGAMENVAAVTFSERFITRGAATRRDRQRTTGVLLHEMAHMWFGDLVTMQWWSDVWLNESFATFMSRLASTNATEFKDDWVGFQSEKAGSYLEDQQVTTHPVASVIPDTNSAFTNFDGITYGKGASVLKQLNYLLGDKIFRDGVRRYIRVNAFKNTQLADFIGALEAVSHRNLKTWAKTWLETAGVDTLQAEFSCRNGHVERFALLRQSPTGESRTHATLVTLYEVHGENLKPAASERVEYSAASTPVPGLIGKKCPAFVYPNDTDQDYVKVLLDSVSVSEAERHIGSITSPLARMMIWQDFYSLVRDVKFTPQELLKMVERNLYQEQDLTIGSSLLNKLSALLYYLPQSTAQEREARAGQVLLLERLLWKKMLNAAPGSDWQRVAVSGLTDIVESVEGRDRLLGLLDGKFKIPGLVLDVDRRWAILIRLAALGDGRVQPLLAAERETDPSARGVENSFAAEAAFPAWDRKQAWLGKIVDKDELSYAQKRQILQNILPPSQDDLRASLANTYFSTLPQLLENHPLTFSVLYGRTLLPATCTPASVSGLKSFITNQSARLPAPVLKILRIGEQEDGRCVNIRMHASAQDS